MNRLIKDWILRFIKGMFIGSGFILPGVSGGAIAAAFGIYERIITFLAHITKDFKKNVLFFMPVGLGGLAGVFLLSFVVSFFLDAYETQILWFFAGCIFGTIPLVWRQAGKEGRKTRHIVIAAIVFLFSYLLMLYGQQLATGNVSRNIVTWALAGALIGLGVIVPGLSPSNFLIYLGMYGPMVDAIKTMDLLVILPLGVGLVCCVLLLSKLMNLFIQTAYTTLFHFILGVVLASTFAIIPLDRPYSGSLIFVCLLLLAAGVLLGCWMGRLEDKYSS